MKLFKSVDEKLKEIGFVKIEEDKYGVRYERKNSKYNFTQSVDILHKASGRHILQSYDNELMDQKKIGRFLKELRKEKDITQEQLAEKIKVSGRTVSRWETGV